MSSIQPEKSLATIINNNFGDGQINIDVLNQFLKSKGSPPIANKKYTDAEAEAIIYGPLKSFLQEHIQGEYKSSKIVLKINSYLLGKNEIGMLTSAPGINNKFLMRYRGDETCNLKSLIQLHNAKNIDGDIENLIVNVASDINVGPEVIRDLIINSKLTIKTVKDIISAQKAKEGPSVIAELNSIMYNEFRRILKVISDKIKTIFDLNIAFWSYPNKGPIGIAPALILPDIPDIDNLIIFNTNLIYKALVKQYDLYFNQIILINNTSNEITKKIKDRDILGLIKNKYGKTEQLIETETEVIEHINFNPFDKDQPLPVIIIPSEGTKERYLLGNAPTYNLYLDNASNDLVGCIRFTNKETGLGTVYWCKEYKS